VYDTYWHYPDPLTGKIKRACKRGFATRRDAARHLKTQTAAAEAGSYVPANRQRLEEYLEQWLAFRGYCLARWCTRRGRRARHSPIPTWLADHVSSS
jgi:hypothetical protein